MYSNLKKSLFAVSAGATLFAASCTKDIAKALFNAFNTSPTTINFTLPIITDTQNQQELGNQAVEINLDSLVKANTANQFGINDIDGVFLESVHLHLSNADSANNLANLENISVSISSNTQTTPLNLFSADIPDQFAADYEVATNKDIELKSYYSSATLNYTINGKARRVTTKELEATVSIVYKIK